MNRDISGLLRRGLMIEAIKEFRDEHGCSLREALDAVQGMRDQMERRKKAAAKHRRETVKRTRNRRKNPRVKG
jgi:ribosomal protein L7/L12